MRDCSERLQRVFQLGNWSDWRRQEEDGIRKYKSDIGVNTGEAVPDGANTAKQGKQHLFTQ